MRFTSFTASYGFTPACQVKAKIYQELVFDDRKSARPWKMSLLFPIQVVRRVEVIDELSQGKLTTEYRYHHGYWAGVEREFGDFGRVAHYGTQVVKHYQDAGLHSTDRPFAPARQAEFSPRMLTKTWFHQGPVVDPTTSARAVLR